MKRLSEIFYFRREKERKFVWVEKFTTLFNNTCQRERGGEWEIVNNFLFIKFVWEKSGQCVVVCWSVCLSAVVSSIRTGEDNSPLGKLTTKQRHWRLHLRWINAETLIGKSVESNRQFIGGWFGRWRFFQVRVGFTFIRQKSFQFINKKWTNNKSIELQLLFNKAIN